MSTGVLVVDDQPMVRRGFRMIIQAEPDMEVVAARGSLIRDPVAIELLG